MNPDTSQVLERLKAFMMAEVLPRHAQVHREMEANPAGHRPALIDALKEKARAQGLWNLGLPGLADGQPGTRLSNVQFAPIAEVLGWVYWAPELFNCHAPDLPNMEMLDKLASPAQREKWLDPLLAGGIYSGFAMTEPGVASSDARNIGCRIDRDGDEWVLNGRKWFVGNCGVRNWRFVVAIGVTDPQAPPTRRHSSIIVPTDAPGFEVVRQVPILGTRHRWSPHGEVRFNNLRVPAENLLGERGKGFAAAQVRLATARIHHCMRFLGGAEIVLRLMIERARQRETFGKRLIERETMQAWIARSRLELDQARLLTLEAARQLDEKGGIGARRIISMIKLAVAEACYQVADRAIQTFGAAGITEDTPVGSFFAEARAFRIYDGPDEVHLQTIARMELAEQDAANGPPLMPWLVVPAGMKGRTDPDGLAS
ncbi:MAG: acyl-CoA dehydrogenase family protein [Burkholderiaceae bacterium]